MRIGIFTNSFYPSVGGVEASSRLMAQTLASLDHEVTVFTRSPLNATNELNERYEIRRNISFHQLANSAARQDLMIVRGGLSKFAMLASTLARAKIVVMHEMARQHAKQPPRYQSFLLKRVHHHVGVARASLATIGIPDGAPTSVLYNPVSETLWGNEIIPHRSRQIDILFVGRLIASKGTWLLAEALSKLTRKVSLSVVGEGPDRIGLTERFAGISSVDATFYGNLAAAELRARYANSRVVVMPSQVIEGMGMVAAEAMANGTPVIVSDQAPLKETIGRGGISFAMGDGGSLRNAIAALLLDHQLWEKCHIAALDERHRFGLAPYRQQLSLLVDEVASK